MASKKTKNSKVKIDNNEKTGSSKSVKWKSLLIPLLIFLVLQEVVLRMAFPLPELSNFNRINYQILDPIGADGPGYLRNINMTWSSSLDTSVAFTHSFNTYGYRDKEWKVKKKAGETRVFFVGDSFVEGMMAPQTERITESFIRSAEASGQSYDVFNCGMMGIGLNEYIKFLVDAVPIFKPDEVFLVLYANDIPFQRPYEPSEPLVPEFNNRLKPRLLEVIQQMGTKAPIPFVWNKETRPFHEPVPAPGNPWTYNSPQLTKQVSERIARAMRLGKFNFFRTNWILEEEKFLKSTPDISQKLQFIRDFLKQQQSKLTVFYIPSRSQVSDFYYQFERQACLVNCPDFMSLTGERYQLHRRVLEQESQRLGFPFYDLTELVKREEDQSNHLYWDFDDHMRGKGYALLGEAIFEAVK
ncbi:MAG: hypothetical protein Roseis2KO_32260 [Roseivirga sp.]